MEDALVQGYGFRQGEKTGVLILVLMEDALVLDKIILSCHTTLS